MTREQLQSEFGLIGDSVEIREIADVIVQVAATDITILITGESGVGKEVVAKAIHKVSNRSSKPMISVNAGAIPEGIIESELFGHEKGAFTGASETRKGYFELADGGTIFLDEIGELPIGTQVKFLRVLENGEYMRVGSATPRKVDVRVIAATNRDLETEVRQGAFRPDLYFRLRSINIRIPSLRERRQDIPLLAAHFARQAAEKSKVAYNGISDEAMDALEAHGWPGNVRELRNVIESMLIIGRGRRIELADVRKYLGEHHENGRNLPVLTRKTPEQAERELIYRALLEVKSDIMSLKQMLEHQRVSADAVPVGNGYVESTMPVDAAGHNGQVLPLEEVEKRMIAGALGRFEGNRRLAAKALNISERTLYRKIKEYRLE